MYYIHTPPTWSEGRTPEGARTKTKTKWTSGCYGRKKCEENFINLKLIFCFSFFYRSGVVIWIRCFLSKTVRRLLCHDMDQTYSIRFHLHNKFKTNTKLHSPFKWIWSQYSPTVQDVQSFVVVTLELLFFLRIFTFTLLLHLSSHLYTRIIHIFNFHNDFRIIAHSNQWNRSIISLFEMLKTNNCGNNIWENCHRYTFT